MIDLEERLTKAAAAMHDATGQLVPNPTTLPPRVARRWPAFAVAVVLTAAALVVGVAALVRVAGDDPPVADSSPPAPTRPPPTAPAPSAAGPLGIEIVALDGSSTHLMLPSDAWTADLSPDGRHVAFLTTSTEVGFCGGCAENQVRLAIVPVGASTGGYVYPAVEGITATGHLAWSPDGRRLAFQAASGGNLDLYVADLTQAFTEDLRYFDVPVARLTTDPGVDEFPAWATDGSTIYYDNLGSGAPGSGMSSTAEIWSMPATGGEATRLTDNDVPDMQPDVGPDGTIVYWRDGEIWTMSPDGSTPRRLVVVPGGLAWNPRWSPDGSKVALLQHDPLTPSATFRPNPIHETAYPLLDVVVVDLDTGSLTSLEAQVASFYNPVSWTPGGTGLLVTRYR